MPKIKVLEFADVINRYDFIDTIIQYADPEKFQVDVCVRTENNNIAKPEFPTRSKYKLLPGLSKTKIPFTAWKLSRLLKKWDIDVLHAHHYDQIIIGWLATRMHRKTKLVIGRHYSDSLYRMQKGLNQKIFFWLEKKANKAAARIIVPSKYIFEILTERQNIDPKKIDIIYYGFDPIKYTDPLPADIASVRNEFKMEGRFVVGNFSRLHEEKGHIYLIESVKKAVTEIPNILVLIIGEGPERKTLEQLIQQNNLVEHIKPVGWRKDAMTIMKAVDVVVQSTLQEAFSQVMCEAFWIGTPLIMTDVSGAIDIINTEENGLIVPKADADALATAMIKLYMDEPQRKKLAQAAKKDINNKLSIDKIIPFFEEAFLKSLQ